jgi:CRP-like cAMP-binding protein
MMRIPAVSELALFDGCGRTELELVEGLLTVVRLPIGCQLMTAGRVARECAVIADGEVSVVDGRGHEVAVLGPGEIVGELGLLRNGPVGATVTTLTPVVAYVANRREFFSLLDVAPDFGRRVAFTAIQRLGSN